MSEQNRTSLWGRVRRLFSGLGFGRATGTGGADSFSALDLRDRVVVMLLFDQVVRVEQVGAAWRYWKDESVDTPDALWRVVARLPEVDAEAVFAQAARVYDFEPTDFSMYSARALVRRHRSTFTSKQWARMVDLNVAPVHTEHDERRDVMHWVFATHDPARPAVQQLLSTLDGAPNHTLRYAPRQPLEDMLDDAFPKRARRRRSEQSLPLPQSTQAGREKEKGRQLLENLSYGTSFVEAALREMGETPAEGAARKAAQANGRKASEMRQAAREGAHCLEKEPHDFTELFDDVLAGAVQAGAQTVYLLMGDEGCLEVYHRRHGTVQPWRIEASVSAEAMIDFVSGRILPLRPAEHQRTEALQHWVGDRRVDFHPSIAPASACSADLPAQEHSEVVVIEMMN